MPFLFENAGIDGMRIISPIVAKDHRGVFLETYRQGLFEKAGIHDTFRQDNYSRSSKRVLRGLHYQKPPQMQSKLVRVLHGRVWDVAVDLRPESKTFAKWFGIELSSENLLMLYIPCGFAHGFLALEDDCEVLYKCSSEYSPESEAGIRWSDPTLNISWPRTDVILSTKDSTLPFLSDVSSFV